jgi:glycosyltransferase involved in cell wall biosynthesis
MKTILVKGPALSRSGYGEQTRFALRSLRAHEDRFNILLQNIPWGHSGWITESGEERDWLDHLIGKTQHHINQRLPIDMSLQVTIPNEWEKIAPVNIGYTAGIEATKVSPQWIEKSALMDRIITISEHSKNVYQNTVYEAVNQQTGEKAEFRTNTPIEVVHYPVKSLDTQELNIDLDYDFNFLTVAQFGPRKNMINTVNWFLQEFRDDEVGLILKTNIANCSTTDSLNTQAKIATILSNYPDAKCKVYLLHGDLTLAQMNSLYINPKVKAYVTHTHGEGFGIPIFEAAYHGVPVIAPAWSGQNDFLHAHIKSGKRKKAKLRALFSKVEYTIGQVPPEAVWEGVIQPDAGWCYPTQQSAKKTMRDVYENYSKHTKIAKQLQKHLLENFTEENQYAKFANAVYAQNEDDWLSEVASIIKEYK